MVRFLRSLSIHEAIFMAIGLAAVVFLVAELVPNGPDPKAFATATGSPTVDVSGITVDPPATGSSITVKTLIASFGNVDASSDVVVRNVTRDITTTAQNWSSAKALTFKVTGGMGDVLEVTCDNNNSDPVTTATIGLVPSPSVEAAPPTFASGGKVTPSYTGGTTFNLQIDNGGVLDQSFNVTVLLSTYDGGSTSSHTFAGTGGASTGSSETLSVTADSDERVYARLEDDYGNVNEYHYIGDQLSLADTTSSSYGVPGSQVPTEHTGNALMVRAGDGSTVVTAKDRQLIHRHNVYTIDHAIHDYPIFLIYRSDLAVSSVAYDGPFGKCFDSPLNMRLVSVNSDEFDFYPGDGRVINFDTYSFDFPTGKRTYESPPGIFFQVIHYVYQQKIEITYANDMTYIFDDYDSVKTFYLTSFEDAYTTNAVDKGPNKIEFVRDDEHQVIQIVGDGSRVTRLAWFSHGRLAEIEDQGRVTLLDYDSEERLVQITRPNDSTLDLSYDSASQFLTRWTEDRNASPGDIDVFKATYASNAVTHIEDRHTLAAGLSNGDAYRFTDVSGSDEGVEVVDPFDATVNYVYEANSDYEDGYIEYEALATDRNTNVDAPAFQDDDPVVWREHFELDVDNLLPAARWLATNTSGSTWVISDEEHWEYTTVSTTDPRLNSRATNHHLVTPGGTPGVAGTNINEFTESWTYGSGGDYFPSAHSSFDGVTTSFTYDSDGPGNVETRTIAGVEDQHWLGTPTTYGIVAELEYNDNGQVAAITNPNRSTSYANMLFAYHDGGLGKYRLEKRQEQSSGGVLGAKEEYTYTSYGEIATRTAPTRTTAERVWENTYDALGRVTVALEPEVTVGGNTIRGETEYVYGNNGFDLDEVKRKFYDENGVAGSGTTGATPSHIVTTYTYDDAGREKFVEADYEAQPSLAPRSTKTEYAYTARGERARVDTYFDTDTTDYDRVSSDYDARGRVLTMTQDPGGVDYETWYRYDGRGREVERFEPESGVSTSANSAFKVSYDVYGRVDEESTPLAALDASGTPATGHYVTETLYSIGTTDCFTAVGTKKRSVLSSTDTVVAHTELKRDNANRVVATNTWYKGVWGTDEEYACETLRLFPDGSVKEAHTAEVGLNTDPTSAAAYSLAVPGDWDYTITELDAFDRPFKTSVHVASHADTAVTYTEQVYDVDTGWVTESKRGEYDEGSTTTLVYVTKYDHDELGRVTKSNEWGTAGSAQEWGVTEYDGLGRVYKQYRAKTGETGVVELRAYNLAGQPVEQRRGLGITGWSSTDLHSIMEWSYDRAGRQVGETRSDGTNDRTVSTVYDELGRVSLVDHYQTGVKRYSYAVSGTSGTLEVTLDIHDLTYVPGSPSASLEYTRVKTQNALGNTLQEEVTYSAGALAGQELVQYTYGADCGCSGSQNPLEIETLDGSSPSRVWMTRVTRTYSPRGEILTEDIEVNEEGGVSNETTMSYNALGQLETVLYPDQPSTSTSRTVDYSLRSDGFITSVAVDSKDVAVYEAQGRRAKLRKALEYGKTDSIADTTSSYDALGRLSEKNYNLEIAAWWDDDFDDTIGSRTVDGKVKTRTNHPIGISLPVFSTPTMEYVGDNWLSEQGWYSDRLQTQAYERNAFGEVYDNGSDPSMTDDAITGCSTDYSEEMDYTRNTAGQLTGILGEQGLQFSDDNPATTPKHTHSFVEGRTFGYDDLGRMTSRAADVTLRHSACDLCSTGTPEGGYNYQKQERSWLYKNDAWGRRVVEELSVDETIYERDCDPYSILNGSLTPVSWTDYDLKRIFDGYGRLVYSSTPINASQNLTKTLGLFHAYANGQRIMSGESGATSTTNLSFEELFPGEGGQVDKYYRSRSGSSDWEYSGAGFATNLYDVMGNVFLSNGTTACSGSAPFAGTECAFPDYGRLWTVSGELVAPPQEADLSEDSAFTLPDGDKDHNKVVDGEGEGPKLLPGEAKDCIARREVPTHRVGEVRWRTKSYVHHNVDPFAMAFEVHKPMLKLQIQREFEFSAMIGGSMQDSRGEIFGVNDGAGFEKPVKLTTYLHCRKDPRTSTGCAFLDTTTNPKRKKLATEGVNGKFFFLEIKSSFRVTVNVADRAKFKIDQHKIRVRPVHTGSPRKPHSVEFEGYVEWICEPLKV